MKILIAGGGTGGHIYPLIPVGEELRKHGHEVIFIGRRESIEERVAKKYGFTVQYVRASLFDLNILKFVKFAIFSINGFFDALKIVGKTKPDKILGGGGYVSLPILLAGILKGVPVYLYEQNTIPGRTNLIFSRFARLVFLGFEDIKNHFGSKGVFVGNPVRKEVINQDKKTALEFFKFEDKFTLLAFGGSGGAYKLNKIIAEAIPELIENEIQIIFITGVKFFDEFKSLSNHKNLRIYPYLDEMGYAYAVSTVAVTRGGAMTLSELILNNVYSIVVPFPYARDNHQFYNAKYFENYGCVSVIKEEDLTKDILVKKIVDFKNDFHIINLECAKFYPRDAEKRIVELLEEDK
ncbi:undecaprenyldiphospho-muramoylpentapeptide beta-N-acetylglucosaminyltransferase [Caldisericum exile]|uniref:UDP-N-acetylglucosamine--N-acetylmuramyl-(pentapeptide) pyrophosphoryl-undecaprenol N-acetylglucosamine transferase n=1 Tax=Caldisericum exile (strain DSM 21853 / NBRC 104410 / AZM16c01) TaxID=511051 RepID=A0A7U6JH33_CALEA|nr:undecaprenyldiphospho-muramoylpentapeptide beta-N-acetylglucosaminyltransferase [Caldisericum exile]BAL81307.1 UDP-N-acetylglucosamine--N-acetylmuramyl-(pentapeptide) pyrophosphoryl-undecaprenol N-acetylglucosamine transferase [Caldisericum exile AZM16c01]